MKIKDLLQNARYFGLRIATAESCTGGMVAAKITAVAGASDVFERGYITYSNAAKVEMLGVSQTSLAQFGAVSPEVAAEMAAGAQTRSGADLAVSITGIAGPGGSDHKPEGRVCFGLARQGQPITTQVVEFGALGRKKVRKAAMEHALALLSNAISP